MRHEFEESQVWLDALCERRREMDLVNGVNDSERDTLEQTIFEAVDRHIDAALERKRHLRHLAHGVNPYDLNSVADFAKKLGRELRERRTRG